MSLPIVTVFGGAGFLGRRVVQSVLQRMVSESAQGRP
jgi:uncharacterized protein YbjT (DUF2867 family)